MPGLRLGLRLGATPSGGSAAAPPTGPTDIAWAGTHTVAEDAALGTVVGGALSFTDPTPGETGVFTLADDAGVFDIGADGTSIIVVGVLDFETAPSPSITIRFTDSSGNFYDEVFGITVTDVSEGAAENPPPAGDVVVEPGEFETAPTVIDVDSGIKFHGKKATGATGKFIYDIGAPLADRKYTMRYDPDFSLLANEGVTAMVGFGLKQGNSFRLSGLKGDGAAGLKAYEVYGTNWNQTTGFTNVDGGAAANGTQAGPNWLQFETSVDGTTYTLRTSADGISWVDEFTDTVPLPHDDVVADYPTFGIAVFLESADSGNFSVKVDLWINEATATVPAQFAFGGWSLVDDGDGTSITLNIVTLPFHGGSAITDLERQIDGGAWVSLGAATTGSYPITGLTVDVEISVIVRALNAVGAGPDSAAKLITPRVSDDLEVLAHLAAPVDGRFEFNGIDTTEYQRIVVLFDGLTVDTASTAFHVNLIVGGNIIAQGYRYFTDYIDSNSGGTISAYSQAAPAIIATSGLPTGSNEPVNGRIGISNPADALFKTITVQMARIATGAASIALNNTGGILENTGTVDGVVIAGAGGQFTAGKATLYGVKLGARVGSPVAAELMSMWVGGVS